MKETTIIFLMLISCAILKENPSALENFIRTQIDPNQEIIIVQDQANTKHLLRILYGSDAYRNNEYERDSPIDGNRSRFITAADWAKIYQKTSYDTVPGQWNRSDFKNIKCTFEDQKGLWNTAFLERFKDNHKKLIWLSAPVVCPEKGYMLFYFASGRTSIPGSDDNSVVIMAQKNNRWEVIDRIYDYRLN